MMHPSLRLERFLRAAAAFNARVALTGAAVAPTTALIPERAPVTPRIAGIAVRPGTYRSATRCVSFSSVLIGGEGTRRGT